MIIVERLRAHHETPSVIRSHPTICDEAADEIARLRALSQNNAHSWDAIVRERDDLRAEIERLRTDIRGYQQDIFHLQGRVKQNHQLAAEIARLRAALHDIAIGGNGERNWTPDEVRAVAWDALQPSNDNAKITGYDVT